MAGLCFSWVMGGSCKAPEKELLSRPFSAALLEEHCVLNTLDS